MAENDLEFESWRKLETTELIKRLRVNRAELFDLITNLNNAQLNRIGNHPRFGDLTVKGWTEFFLLHEAHHLFTIFQLGNTKS